MSKMLTPKGIPIDLILDKLQQTHEQKKFSFPTEYGTDNPKVGFDRQRYLQERTSNEERRKSYFTS